MKNKERIFNLLDILIVAEKVRDSKDKQSDPKLSGESAMLYHLRRLREMLVEELGA